jgi:hypothetical protein
MNAAGSEMDISTLLGNQDEVGDPMLAILTNALSGGNRLDPFALLKNQLHEQVRDNPQAAQVLQLLEQNRERWNSEAQEEDAELLDQERAEENRSVSDSYILELEENLNRAYVELEELQERNDMLALALGACHLCFGEDALCKECGGRGAPGSRPPKPAAFRKYVLPAYRRAKAIEDEADSPASNN